MKTVSFKTLRRHANASGILQINIGHSVDTNEGFADVRTKNGVLRVETDNFPELKARILKWKKAQGVPFCFNGAPKGLVGKNHMSA